MKPYLVQSCASLTQSHHPPLWKYGSAGGAGYDVRLHDITSINEKRSLTLGSCGADRTERHEVQFHRFLQWIKPAETYFLGFLNWSDGGRIAGGEARDKDRAQGLVSLFNYVQEFGS